MTGSVEVYRIFKWSWHPGRMWVARPASSWLVLLCSWSCPGPHHIWPQLRQCDSVDGKMRGVWCISDDMSRSVRWTGMNRMLKLKGQKVIASQQSLACALPAGAEYGKDFRAHLDFIVETSSCLMERRPSSNNQLQTRGSPASSRILRAAFDFMYHRRKEFRIIPCSWQNVILWNDHIIRAVFQLPTLKSDLWMHWWAPGRKSE